MTPTPTPACPRCGYDLSGVVTAWETHCPLVGVCSECGLDFEWADVLVPSRQKLPWLYEHAPRWRSARAAFGTWLRVLLPWVFWKRVKMHHEVRLPRLLVWPALLWGSLYIIGVTTSFASATLSILFLSHWSRTSLADLPVIDILTWVYPNLNGFETTLAISVFNLIPAVFSAGPLFVIFIFRSSRCAAKVRQEHLIRATVYGLASAILLMMIATTITLLSLFYEILLAASGGNPFSVSGPIDTFYFAMQDFYVNPPPWLGLAMLLWSLVYWWFALHKGLRLKDAAAVLILGAVLSVLVLGLFVLWPSI